MEEQALQRAIHGVIEGCIRDGVLSGFLKEHKEAVIMQSIWAYDAEAAKRAGVTETAFAAGMKKMYG